MQNIPKLDFFPCPSPTHKQQPLSRICLDPSCSSNSLLCYDCQKQSHSHHHTIPLQQFFETLQTKRFGASFQSSLTQLKTKIKSSRNDVLGKINLIKQDIVRKLDELIASAEKRFDELMGRVEVQCEEMRSRLGFVMEYDVKVPIERMLGYFKGQIEVLKAYEQIERQVPKKAQLASKSISFINAHFSKLLNKLKESTSTSNSILNLPIIIKLVPQQIQLPNNNLAFDLIPQSRHPDLDVSNYEIKRARKTTKQQLVGALGNLKFNEPGKIYHWAVKFAIQGFTLYSAGICLEKKAKQQAYHHMRWTFLNHGHYAVQNNGRVYSLSDSSVNTKKSEFKITNSQVVHFQYDTKQNILIVWKNNYEDYWSFAVQPAPKDDCYRPCFYLFQIGDAASLIQQK